MHPFPPNRRYRGHAALRNRLLSAGRAAWTLALAIWLGAGCGGDRSGQEVARVGDHTLTQDEMIALTTQKEKRALSDNEKREFVRQWVDTEVLYRQALREKLDQDSRIRYTIRQMEKELLAAELMEKRGGGEMAIDNRQIEQFYLDHPEHFILPERRVRARHILLTSAEEAGHVHDELKRGRSFEALAKEVSIDSATAPLGGDLGFFTAGEVALELSLAAFSLSINEISRPVRTERGVHIIQVTEIQPEGTVLPLEEVRHDIARAIFGLKQQQLFDATIKELKEHEHIEINWDRIDFKSSAEKE